MNKITKMFVGLLIILTILVAGLYSTSLGLFDQKQVSLAFPNVKKEAITKLVLTDAQKTLTFTKNNNSWSLDVGGQVDQTKVNALIDLILSTKKDNLVSTNKANQTQFGIGLKKVDFYVGTLKNTINYGNDFDLSNIYLVTNSEDKTYSTDNKVNDYFVADSLVIKNDVPTPTTSPTY